MKKELDSTTAPEDREPLAAAGTEVLGEYQAGQLLSAVGSHEAKAALLVFMQANVAYRNRALSKIYLDGQGIADDGRSKGLQAQYCSGLFVPVGLAEALDVKGERGRLYRLTPVMGAIIGRALAGQLLNLSDSYPDKSLRDMFGAAQAAEKGMRVPIRRVRLLRELIDSDDSSIVNLAKDTGQEYSAARDQLRNMGRVGLLNIDTRTVDQLEVSYGLGNTIKPAEYEKWFANPLLSEDVVTALNRRRAYGQPINLDNVIHDLRQDYRYRRLGAPSIRRQVSTFLSYLERQECIQRTEDFVSRERLSYVTLRPEALPLAKDIVSVAERLADSNPEFIKDGLEMAKFYAVNPKNIHSLVEKGFESSPQTGKMSVDELAENIAHVLEQRGGLTVNEIADMLQEVTPSTQSVQRALRYLSKKGEATSTRIKGVTSWRIKPGNKSNDR